MGRPKKYLTEESKREANRRNNRKFYLNNRSALSNYKMLCYYSVPPEERKKMTREKYERLVNKNPETREKYLNRKMIYMRKRNGTSVESPTRKFRKWAFVGGKLIPVRTEEETLKYGRYLTHGLGKNNPKLYKKLWHEAVEREKKKRN